MSDSAAVIEDHGAPAASRCDWRAASVDGRWPLERVLFTLAGFMVLLSTLLALLVSPWFLALTAFVGLNQVAYAALGACPSSLVIAKAFGVRPGVNAGIEKN